MKIEKNISELIEYFECKAASIRNDLEHDRHFNALTKYIRMKEVMEFIAGDIMYFPSDFLEDHELLTIISMLNELYEVYE